MPDSGIRHFAQSALIEVVFELLARRGRALALQLFELHLLEMTLWLAITLRGGEVKATRLICCLALYVLFRQSVCLRLDPCLLQKLFGNRRECRGKVRCAWMCEPAV